MIWSRYRHGAESTAVLVSISRVWYKVLRSTIDCGSDPCLRGVAYGVIPSFYRIRSDIDMVRNRYRYRCQCRRHHLRVTQVSISRLASVSLPIKNQYCYSSGRRVVDWLCWLIFTAPFFGAADTRCISEADIDMLPVYRASATRFWPFWLHISSQSMRNWVFWCRHQPNFR